MIIEQWDIRPELKKELDSHYKTAFSLSLTENNPMSIAHALTFDGLADSITITDLVRFLESIDRHFLGGKFKGIGLEVGAGPGTFVAAFSRLPEVKKMYGIEACSAIVEKLMTKVVAHIAGDYSEKVIGVVADFDHLELPDSSVDFIFDFFSLHHSPDPSITIKELSRVLKPEGVLVCIDKARANCLSDADLKKLLDIEYNEKTKISMGLSPDKIHTRRMNGEKEYRLNDWNRYFMCAGLSNLKHYNVAKIGGKYPIRIVKRMIALFPIKLQVKFSRLISKKITNNLEPNNRIFSNVFPKYPREFSLMVASKK